MELLLCFLMPHFKIEQAKRSLQRQRERGSDGARDCRLSTRILQAANAFGLCKQATSQLTENVITLKGSTELVTEFFSYSINRCRRRCVLLQR